MLCDCALKPCHALNEQEALTRSVADKVLNALAAQQMHNKHNQCAASLFATLSHPICVLQATVVNRELVAVLTRGTLTDAEMLASTPDASYLMAITEGPPAGPRAPDSIDAEPVVIGVCAVDAATGQMLLGQWCGTCRCV